MSYMVIYTMEDCGKEIMGLYGPFDTRANAIAFCNAQAKEYVDKIDDDEIEIDGFDDGAMVDNLVWTVYEIDKMPNDKSAKGKSKRSVAEYCSRCGILISVPGSHDCESCGRRV